ncbi:oxygen-independent coproporphyrinogen III oxidase [Rhizobium sp. L1K21]|uniref:oxygen-independent coproporphyrinogen III oxidase n=1 Tax=Rhizobium sp. L1K21 TaxID=2954933 RepID=UPI00209264AE|nr:oxygen-independent coproporphyrinogen III oxidase [Rhizobium sp. L1K21]MCO6185806.1 oxygen-independent coproporphyrinogen III oxidase [Rhizobium sp. L1K21]
MHKSLVGKYSAPVPRYTSYPTAPHFDVAIGNGEYGQWLAELSQGASVSLYIHVPYCDRLCWFCACHTKHTLKYEPVATYIEALFREIEAVSSRLREGVTVSALHFGGGSPTMMTPEDIIRLGDHLKSHFSFQKDAKISVEMDPNDMDDARYDALAEIGMTRASLGVQDFDPKVQKTINRIQTFDHTRSVVEAVRARGVHSVNCDLLYGLPYQTLETLENTVSQITSLDPDRIALFGYAHVPWMKKHQTMIPEAALPDVSMRFEQARLAARLLQEAGYQTIGIDHFAKPDDSLAVAAREGRMRRNFQGYTDDAADALIGLGASSIGQFPQGYVQNMTATGEYQRMTEESGLAAVRGIALSSDDVMRAYVIERIMCDFRLSFADLDKRFGALASAIRSEARQFAVANDDNLVEIRDDECVITEHGKPFARTIAATFDAYLSNGKGRHSIAV